MALCYNYNGDNMNFKYDEITINNVTFDIIIDEEGTRWYPFTKILKRVLKKDEDANKYRDTSFGKDLRLWAVKNPTPYVSELWYIKESALIRYLKNVKVNPYTEMTAKRVLALYGALEYFGIKRQERDNTYTVVKPTATEYSDWELLCFKFDPEVQLGIIWRRCDTCDRYFPYTKTYFQKNETEKEMTTCLECIGKTFEIKNKDIRKMQKYGREELIKYIDKENPVGLYLQLEKNPLPEELQFFQNKSRILQILKYVETRKVRWGKGSCYLSKIGKPINMHAKKLKNIIGKDFEIGTVKPLEKHTKQVPYEELTEVEKRVKERLEQEREEKRKAKKLRDTEYWKKKLRDETAAKRKENIENIFNMCEKNVKEYKLPSKLTQVLFPQSNVVYAFVTKKNIHFVTYEIPIEKKQIIIHKIPLRNDKFKKIKDELMEAFKENEN